MFIPVAQTKLVTYEEFEAFLTSPENQQRLFELIHGEIIEKMPTDEHGDLVGLLIGELYIYFKGNPIGRVQAEVLHRLPSDQLNACQPDISIKLDTTTPPIKKGAVPRMPDIAIEVKSPSDTYKAMRERADYYIQNGSKIVVLLFPEKQLIEVYYPGKDVIILDIHDTLEVGDMLPGFVLPVSAIFGVKQS